MREARRREQCERIDPVLVSRLATAAARLAAVLNQVLGAQPRQVNWLSAGMDNPRVSLCELPLRTPK